MKEIVVNGILYNSITEAAREHKHISYNTIVDRLYNGWTPNQAFGYEPPKKEVGNSKSITLNGITYSSRKKAHKVYNKIPYPTVITRLNDGWTPEEAYGLVKRKIKINKRRPPHNKSITLNGITYSSRRKAHEVHNKIPYSTVITRLNDGWTPEEAYGLVKRKIKNKRKNSKRKPYSKNKYINGITVGGIFFDNLTKACIYYNKDYNKTERRLNRGWSIDEAFDLVAKNLGEIKLHGRVFDTLEEAVKAYRLNIYFIYRELRKGKTLPEAFHIRNNDALIINGKRYKYIENVLNKIAISDSKYMYKIKKGWFIEEIIEGKRLYSTDKYYEIDGKRFKNLSDLSNYYKVNRDTVYTRIFRGWSLKDAIIGKRNKKKGKNK